MNRVGESVLLDSTLAVTCAFVQARRPRDGFIANIKRQYLIIEVLPFSFVYTMTYESLIDRIIDNFAFLIYNVYQEKSVSFIRGGIMQITVSKWGNSLGIRIPTSVINALSIKNGDNISYEVKDNSLVLKKEMTTKEMFESFYKKPIDELTIEDLGPSGELDWGNDVGGEVF